MRPLPSVPDDWFEALVAGRNVLLLNELLGTTSADFRAMLPRYADEHDDQAAPLPATPASTATTSRVVALD